MRDGACSIGREGLATFGAVSLDVRLDEGHHHVVVPDNPRGGRVGVAGGRIAGDRLQECGRARVWAVDAGWPSSGVPSSQVEGEWEADAQQRKRQGRVLPAAACGRGVPPCCVGGNPKALPS